MSKQVDIGMVVVGAVGTIWGCGALSNLDDYRPEFVRFALGLFGVYVLMLAYGVGKLTRPASGVAIVLVAAAVAAVAVLLARAKAEENRDYEPDAAILEAAVAVCRGTSNAAAADRVPGAKRGIMQVSRWPNGPAPNHLRAETWDGLQAPRTLAELQLVVCRVRAYHYVAPCDYTHHYGSPPMLKHMVVDTLTVRDAKTLQVISEKTFEGSEPMSCVGAAIVPALDVVIGEPPSEADETAFLRFFVESVEK